MSVHSEIDSIYCSKTLAPRVTHYRADDRPKYWGPKRGGTLSSYHKALICRMSWKGLWPTSPDVDPGRLEGSTLPKGPNYRAWSDDKAAMISKKVDHFLGSTKIRLELRKIRKSRLPPSGKRDALFRIFKKAILKAASDSLPHPPKSTEHKPEPLTPHEQWGRLVPLVSSLLKKDILGHFGNPITIDNPELQVLSTWFSQSGTDLPSTLLGWQDWWPHRD